MAIALPIVKGESTLLWMFFNGTSKVIETVWKHRFDPAEHKKLPSNLAEKRPTVQWLQDGNGKPGEGSATGLLCRLCNEQPELQYHKGF